MHENQRGGGKFGFQPKKPNNQDKSGEFGGRRQMGGKRKNGQGTKAE